MMRLSLLLLTVCAITASLPSCSDAGDGVNAVETLKIEICSDPGSGIEEEPGAAGVLVANFYSNASHELVSSGIIRPPSGSVKLRAGEYQLVAYSFDTRSSHVRAENCLQDLGIFVEESSPAESGDFHTAVSLLQENANALRAYAGQKLMNEPDHIFICIEDNVTVRESRGKNAAPIVVSPVSCVATRRFRIGPVVSGADHFVSANAYLTSQAASMKIFPLTLTGEAAVIPGKVTLDKAGTYLDATIHTFGTFPEMDSEVFLILCINYGSGSRIIYEWKLPEQLPDARDGLISVKEEITIPGESGAGQFQPDVNPWGTGDNTVIEL